MSQYPFKFENHPKKKGVCPKCGNKKSFRYYENESGTRLSEEFGKCERINACDYHNQPYRNNLNQEALIFNTKESLKYPDEKTIENIKIWESNFESNFHKYWNQRGIPNEHFNKHGVGSNKDGLTIFVHRGIHNKILNAKFIKYNLLAKRDKIKNNSFYLKQPTDIENRLSIPLYGEELLDSNKEKTIIIVESEKSKVIASFYYPDYDWLACGSNNGITKEKAKVLVGRNVIWLCDADKAGRNNSSLSNLKSLGINFNILDISPDKQDGSDIVDEIEMGNIPNLKNEIEKILIKNKANSSIFLKSKTVEYRENYSIWTKTKNNWEEVSDNFLIFIKNQTKDVNDELTWILEIKIKSREDVYEEVTHEEFCSAKKMKNILAKHRLSFRINDIHLSEIQGLLFLTHFNTAIKIIRYGLHRESEIYFFSNKALLKTGELVEPDKFNIVNSENFCLSMPLSNQKMKKRFEHTDNEITFNEWYYTYSKAHTQNKAFIPVCFYIMSLFRDIIVEHKGSSPILFLKGSAGTGKSSIIRHLTCLFGFQQEDINLKTKNTEAALVKLMSQSANSLIWMDEFHNDFQHEGLLQAAYDNAGYHKTPDSSKNNTDTDSIEIHSALALTSNYIPTNDIFFSRCVLVNVETEIKTIEQKENYNILKQIEKNGLACISIEILKNRQLIKDNYETDFKKLQEKLVVRFNGKNIAERLFSNMLQTITCAFILQKANKIAICEYVEENDIIDEFINIAEDYIISQKTIQQEKSILSEFFEIVQLLFENYKIHEGLHFRFENDLLFLRFPSIYTEYKFKYRSIYHKESPDKDTIIQELLKLEQKPKNEVCKTIRFRDGESNSLKNAVSNSISITYQIYFEKFSLDLNNRKN